MVKTKRGKPRTRTRRPKGEDSVYRRADGLWTCAIDLGKGSEGKRRRRVFYAPSRAELLRKVADLRARGGGTIKPRADGTVGEWLERWLRDDVKPNRSPNTFAQYETMWRVHAGPILGAVPLERFDVEHVEALYVTLRESGVSSAVRHRVGVVLGRAFEVAIRRRIYHRANPLTLVEKPRHRAKEAKTLTLAEAQRFLREAAQDRYAGLWVLLLTSGLRIGEALGLEWADVDLEAGTIAVRQSLAEVNGRSLVGPLKTKGSRRRIEIGALTIAALRRHRATGLATSDRFVFATSTGGHPSRAVLRQRYFLPTCKRAKITGLTIHGLRHSMTSLAIAQGTQVKIIAERLGHSTVRLTQDRYGHVLPGLQREAVDALEATLAKV